MKKEILRKLVLAGLAAALLGSTTALAAPIENGKGATGKYAVAIGDWGHATGEGSVASGGGTASGTYSIACGSGYAFGDNSVAIGGGGL